MRKLIDVLRQSPEREAKPYHQVFAYETDDETVTVATALRELNAAARLVDVEGNAADPISWECSCLQKKCGACAMIVEGRPRAACDAKLAEFKGEIVHLAPLRKFPVIADLAVDRSSLFDRMKQLELWLGESVELPTRNGPLAYEASRCLECGCCLEACPNFSVEGEFGGMAAMVPLTRLILDATGDERARHARAYRQAVYAGCGKSLACRDVCPARIDISRLMSRSNAVAVWRWLR